MLVRLSSLLVSLTFGLLARVDAAGAAERDAQGVARPWQLGLQDAASPVMERIHQFHDFLLAIQVLIVLLVLSLLGYCIYRFNARRNPLPSKTSHNTLLEVVWTAVPIVILVVIAIPSLRLLYYADRTADYEMTLKVVGHQWYWSYAYPDHGDFTFDSIMIPDDEIDPAKGQVRQLSVDEPVVLPVKTKVQILVTTNDVIHNWAVPALGLKMDSTPGRINETWVEITREGTYYGMCSELCGVNHAYMPIQIEAVSKERFREWVSEAQARFTTPDGRAVAVAEADAPPANAR